MPSIPVASLVSLLQARDVEDRMQQLIELRRRNAQNGCLLRRSDLHRTISTAMRTAAGPVRLPLRVCSMYSVPSWTVNSKSCMSL